VDIVSQARKEEYHCYKKYNDFETFVYERTISEVIEGHADGILAGASKLITLINRMADK